MNHKKKWNPKLIAGICVCTVALSGLIGYGAYTYWDHEPEAETTAPLSPTTPKKSTPVFPKKEKSSEKGLTEGVKQKTNDSSLEDFKNSPITTYAQEKKQALALLDNQVQKEQKSHQEKRQEVVTQAPTFTPLPTKPTVPKDNNNQKPVEPEKPVKPVEPEIPPVPEVDYSALAQVVEQAQGIDFSLYLSSSTEQLKLELLISQRMLEDLTSSQESINTQVYRVQVAMNQLVLKGNKTELQAVYTHSNTIKTDIYTEETVNALIEQQRQAKNILDNSEVSQAQVDQAKQDLQQAVDSLKEKEEPYLSLAYLQRLVDTAKSIILEDYTPSTVVSFQNKLDQVTTYISEGTYTKSENEQYLEELQQAINQLQKKANLSQINELLEKIKIIDREQYTEESLVELDSAVEKAKEQLLNEELTQSEADTIYTDLQQAFNKLEEKTEKI